MFLIPVLFSLIISCSPVYVPNAINSPSLEEKGQINAGLQFGTTGLDIQTACAASNHAGVMLNGSFPLKDESEKDRKHEHTFGEIGIGYWGPFADNASSFDTFIGFGIGKSLSENTLSFISDEETEVTGYYKRWFIQTDCSISRAFFRAGISARAVYVDFYRFKANSISYDKTQSDFFFEPAIFTRMEHAYFFTQVQVGLCIPINQESVINYEPIFFNAGFHVKLNALGNE